MKQNRGGTFDGAIHKGGPVKMKKSLSKDEVRSALTAYIARHAKEDRIPPLRTLSRFFRRMNRMTPTEYRKKIFDEESESPISPER